MSHAVLGCGWVKRVWFGGMGLRFDMGDDVDWSVWLLTMQELGSTGGEAGRRRRIIGETMA